MNFYTWLKRIISGHNCVSEDNVNRLFDAYKTLYETSGKFYNESTLNLDRYSANEILTNLTNQMRTLSKSFNEFRIENEMLKNKINKMKKEKENAEHSDADTTDATMALSAEVNSLKEECARLQNELLSKNNELIGEKEENIKKTVETLREFINFRDNLFLIEQAATIKGDDKILDIISGLISSSRDVFKSCNVEVLDGIGDFDIEYQQVVATVPTSNISLNEKVAETVRCGYRFHDSIIRLQEVKTFSFDPTI